MPWAHIPPGLALINDADFYQMAAWVEYGRVSGQSPGHHSGYRFNPSGNRVDVGAQTLTDSNWTS